LHSIISAMPNVFSARCIIKHLPQQGTALTRKLLQDNHLHLLTSFFFSLQWNVLYIYLFSSGRLCVPFYFRFSRLNAPYCLLGCFLYRLPCMPLAPTSLLTGLKGH